MSPLSKLLASVAAAAALNAGTASAQEKKPEPPKADEKKPEIDPKDVRVGPPPELAELRKAVEEAARKGENVEEIRKQLDALEKALAGKPWVKPRLVEDLPPRPPVAVDPGRLPPPIIFANPRPGGVNAEQMQKIQELMLKAALLRGDDAAAAEKLLKEARELMGKQGGLLLPPPIFDVLPVPARGVGGRLGIKVENVPAAIAEKFNLPEGKGVLAAEILPDSPAEKAGLQANDVIVEFGGKAVSTESTVFVRTVQSMKPGQKVDIVYYRKGKKSEAKGVVLAELDNRRGALDPLGPFNPPVPNLLPLPVPAVIPPVGAVPPLPIVVDPAQASKNRNMSVRIQNDTFQLDAEDNGVKFAVLGKVAGEKLEPNKITVTSGKRVVDAESVEKLPEEFRKSVQKLLDEVKVKSAK